MINALWLLFGVVSGVSLVVIYRAMRAPMTPSGPARKLPRRDPVLMTMLAGDAAKYDRLVRYHGSIDAAKIALIRDRR